MAIFSSRSFAINNSQNDFKVPYSSAQQLKFLTSDSDYKAQVDLMFAIKNGDVSGVQKALSDITDINSVILNEEFTPLQYASLPSNNTETIKIQILRLLLSKYTKINDVGFGSWQGTHAYFADWTPLMIAYAHQSESFINELIAAGAKLDLNHSLFAAAKNNIPPLTEKLIKSGAKVNYQINKYGFDKMTPLMVASDDNIDLLLSLGANSNMIDGNGNSVLMNAINNRKYDTSNKTNSIISLIKAGANLDHQNTYGDTALIFSVNLNLPEFTEVLLASGALTEIKNRQNKTALYISSDLTPFWNNSTAWNKQKKLKIATALIKHGAKVEDALLAHTFFMPDADYIEILLSSGVNVNIVTKNGGTPLTYAVQDKYAPFEVTKLLVNHGANVNFRNEYLSVLDYAVKAEDVKKIAVLKDSGVLLDDQDPSDGHTATMFAAGWDRYESVKFLISVGANLNLQDKDGKTALDHAVSSEVKKLIKQAGGLSGAEIK